MIPLFSVNMPPQEELMPELEEVLYSGYIGQGPKVEAFEKEFAKFIGYNNVLSLNSGTSALHLALRLAGVKGGEVITTPMTCTATNMPILANEAGVVWADIDPATGMLDPTDVERKITRNTKAIMVVHWGGSPADLGGLAYIRDKYGIPLIEDAAHALGAEYRGRKIGNQTADFTCFSFQAIKHLTTVDGGILIARDSDQYKRGKLLRWYGIDREGDRKDFRCEEDIAEWGYKFHMNDVAATIGLVQLRHLERTLGQHRQVAAYYESAIKNPYIRKPAFDAGSSWWLYTLRVDSRDEFMKHMARNHVQVSRVHERNDKHTAFRAYARSPLPGLEEFARHMVCIPVHSRLHGDEGLVAMAANMFLLEYIVGP